jgi:DNA-binding MarR family transcriptional regulator
VPKSVDDELMVAIQRLGRLMSSRRVSDRIRSAADADVSRQGMQILRVLHREGELAIAGLAAAAGMDVSAVSRQVRSLEQAGLVQRAPAVRDGRVALVSLTPPGSEVARRIRSVGLSHLTESLSGWSPRDRRELGRLLARLVDDLERTQISGQAPEIVDSVN